MGSAQRSAESTQQGGVVLHTGRRTASWPAGRSRGQSTYWLPVCVLTLDADPHTAHGIVSSLVCVWDT